MWWVLYRSIYLFIYWPNSMVYLIEQVEGCRGAGEAFSTFHVVVTTLQYLTFYTWGHRKEPGSTLENHLNSYSASLFPSLCSTSSAVCLLCVCVCVSNGLVLPKGTCHQVVICVVMEENSCWDSDPDSKALLQDLACLPVYSFICLFFHSLDGYFKPGLYTRPLC